jgi:hypothetical protein
MISTVTAAFSFNWRTRERIGDNAQHMDQKREETQKALQDHQIKEANAENMWAQVKAWIEKFVERENREATEQIFRFNEGNSTHFTVVSLFPDGRPTLSASFDRSTNFISYGIDGGEASSRVVFVASQMGVHTFLPAVTGTDFHFMDEQKNPVTVEAMGRAMIKTLVGMP